MVGVGFGFCVAGVGWGKQCIGDAAVAWGDVHGASTMAKDSGRSIHMNPCDK